MERNKLLKKASLVCTILSYLQIAGIIISTIALFHWHFDKEFYRITRITVNAGEGFSLNIFSSDESAIEQEMAANAKKADVLENKIALSEVDKAAVYFLYAKGVVVMFFLFLIFREFGKVIQSVKALETFKADNVESFRKMGKYFLVVFWCSGFHYISTGGASRVSFDFELTPLVLMLVAYVLAEIFKEGNRLQVEEQLTI